jgi:hypothetical protein
MVLLGEFNSSQLLQSVAKGVQDTIIQSPKHPEIAYGNDIE